MSFHLRQRCFLMLLGSMVLALVGGLLAFGPVWLGPDATRSSSDEASWSVRLLNLLTCLPIIASGLWGLVVLRHSRWPRAVVRLWTTFFVMIAVLGSLLLLHQQDPSPASHVNVEIALSAVSLLLMQVFLAERCTAPWLYTPLAVAGACGIALLGGAWAWLTGWIGPAADLRALLLSQWVPLLLIPAGALSLRSVCTKPLDASTLMVLLLLTQLCRMADSLVLNATAQHFDGHMLMHLALAALAAWVAYRAGAEAETEEAAGKLTRRQTSLKTSS